MPRVGAHCVGGRAAAALTAAGSRGPGSLCLWTRPAAVSRSACALRDLENCALALAGPRPGCGLCALTPSQCMPLYRVGVKVTSWTRNPISGSQCRPPAQARNIRRAAEESLAASRLGWSCDSPLSSPPSPLSLPFFPLGTTASNPVNLPLISTFINPPSPQYHRRHPLSLTATPPVPDLRSPALQSARC